MTPNETGTRPATSTASIHLVAGAQCCHFSRVITLVLTFIRANL